MFPAVTQHCFSVQRTLFVRDECWINVKCSISAGLNFEKQVFRVKPRTPLSVTHWVQKCKTKNFVSNTNREVGFRLINIFLHMSKNVLGIVWWFHEFTNVLRPYCETQHKTQATQNFVESSEISTITVWTISFIIFWSGS